MLHLKIFLTHEMSEDSTLSKQNYTILGWGEGGKKPNPGKRNSGV